MATLDQLFDGSDAHMLTEIERAMAAWNEMTEQERANALKAAGSARPVDAMRHLGWGIPADMPPNG